MTDRHFNYRGCSGFLFLAAGIAIAFTVFVAIGRTDQTPGQLLAAAFGQTLFVIVIGSLLLGMWPLLVDFFFPKS